VCCGVLLSCVLFFAAMCTSWMVFWLRVFWWPVCVDYVCVFFSQLPKLRSKKFPLIKKYTQFFFLFQCQEYKYCISKDKFGCSSRVRPCCHPCLSVRNPYLILHARPTFSWRHSMMIILMYTRRYLRSLQDKSGDLQAYNFQVFTIVRAQIVIFWVVTSCIFCGLFYDGGAGIAQSV
jgi:hypothetical protein